MRWWYFTHTFDVNVCEHSHYRLLSIPFLSAVRSTALSLTHWHKHSPASRQCHLSCSYRAENRSSAVTHVWLNMKSLLLSLNILLIFNTSLGMVESFFSSLCGSVWGVVCVQEWEKATRDHEPWNQKKTCKPARLSEFAAMISIVLKVGMITCQLRSFLSKKTFL